MASAPRYSYQRLKHEGLSDDYEENESFKARPGHWFKSRRMHVRRRSFRLKVPSLSRFLRKKFRVVRASCTKVLRRLKEGKAHFGDIFGGNYLFMQINPTSLKYLEKSYHGTALKFNGFAPRKKCYRASPEPDLELIEPVRHIYVEDAAGFLLRKLQTNMPHGR